MGSHLNVVINGYGALRWQADFFYEHIDSILNVTGYISWKTFFSIRNRERLSLLGTGWKSWNQGSSLGWNIKNIDGL